MIPEKQRKFDDEGGLDESIQRIVIARANRLGVSTAEVLEGRKVPRFYEAAAIRARELGVTVQEVLDRDLRTISDSEYPGPECFQPYEVERFIQTRELPTNRISHLDTCRDCGSLLVAAVPKEAKLNDFLRELQWLIPTALAIVETETADAQKSATSGAEFEANPIMA